MSIILLSVSISYVHTSALTCSVNNHHIVSYVHNAYWVHPHEHRTLMPYSVGKILLLLDIGLLTLSAWPTAQV